MKNLTANSMKLRAIFALFAGVTWLNAPSTPAFADSSPQAQLAVSQDLATSQKHKKKRHKPNILAVLTDDVGIDQVPLYGFHSLSVPATPNLEALQGAGLTSATPGQCLPARRHVAYSTPAAIRSGRNCRPRSAHQTSRIP